MGYFLLLRPVRMPDRPTAWIGGRQTQPNRLLTEEVGLPDYPGQFLIENGDRILLEQ